MEQKDSLDVLMIGSSEVYSDYSPAIAWENYGYTSYDLSMGAAPANLYKDMIKRLGETESEIDCNFTEWISAWKH